MNDHPRSPGQPDLPELDDEQALAVAAVVDGDASAEERALVAGSPGLASWVEELRGTSAALREVPVDPAARERSIAAALSVFDELYGASEPSAAAASTPPPAPVVSMVDRRRRWRMSPSLLGAAAAVVAVLAIGAVALNTQGGEDDTFSEPPSASTAKIEGGDEPSAEAEDASTQLAPASGAAPTIGEINDAGDVADEASAATEAPIAMDAPVEAATGDTTAAASEVPAGTAAGDSAGGTPTLFSLDITERVSDPQALLAYAARVDAERRDADAPQSSEAPPTPPATSVTSAATVDACTAAAATDGGELLGYVLYGPDEVPAAIVRDAAQDDGGVAAGGQSAEPATLRAIAIDTCQVLVIVNP